MEEITIQGIVRKVAKENNWSVEHTREVWDAIASEIIINNLNSTPARVHPLGYYEVVERKGRVVKNYFGEVEIPTQEVLKFRDAPLYRKIFQRKDCYSYVIRGKEFLDFFIVVDKYTKKIQEEGDYWGCLLRLIEVWGGKIIIIAEKEKIKEIESKINDTMVERENWNWVLGKLEKTYKEEKIIFIEEESINE